MAKDYTLVYHEVALLPVQDKTSFLTSPQNFVKIVQAVIKRSPIDGEIIHGNFNNFFIEIKKYGSHASLKVAGALHNQMAYIYKQMFQTGK